MKRNMDLVRSLLMGIEACGYGEGPRPDDESFPGFSKEVVAYHLILMNEAGLITGGDASSRDGLDFLPLRLTWEGHEFLDACRNQGIWDKAKKTVGDKLGATSVAVLSSLLIELAKEKLGLKS